MFLNSGVLNAQLECVVWFCNYTTYSWPFHPNLAVVYRSAVFTQACAEACV